MDAFVGSINLLAFLVSGIALAIVAMCSFFTRLYIGFVPFCLAVAAFCFWGAYMNVSNSYLALALLVACIILGILFFCSIYFLIDFYRFPRGHVRRGAKNS